MQTQNEQTRYESIKNAAKKYAAIGMIAGAVAMPAYAGNENAVVDTEITQARTNHSGLLAITASVLAVACSAAALNKLVEDRK